MQLAATSATRSVPAAGAGPITPTERGMWARRSAMVPDASGPAVTSTDRTSAAIRVTVAPLNLHVSFSRQGQLAGELHGQ